MNTKKIKFFDEKDVEVKICETSKFKYISPFEPPFLEVDTFAKKTTLPAELVYMSLEDLRKIGFIVTSIKAGRHAWFSRQQSIYRIEDISNLSPKSKKMNALPSNHKIQKDNANRRIRLMGTNAGYPHKGNGGPWIEEK